MNLSKQQWRTMSLLGMFQTRTFQQLTEHGCASVDDIRLLAAYGLIAAFIGDTEIDITKTRTSTLKRANFARTTPGTAWLRTPAPRTLSALAEATTGNRMIAARRVMAAAEIDKSILYNLGTGGYLTARDARGNTNVDWHAVASIPDQHWLGISRAGLYVTARGPA